MGYFIKSFICLIFLISPSLASDAKFGQYNYTPYMGLNQQLQYQRNLKARNYRARNPRYYNQNPTRNIILPRGAASGYYPNIDKNRTPVQTRSNYRYY